MKETSWEYAGRNVEEATQTALEELGLEPDDIHVEILEEPQKGFLGLGGKEARIRVELIGEWEAVKTKMSPREIVAPEIEVEEEDRGQETFLTKEGGELPESSKPIVMVKDILEMIGTEAMVEGRLRDESIVVDVWGDDVAILIGKAGATLDAMQYLLNIACRRKGDVDRKIILDVEGYRKRRKAKVEKQADQSARKAIAENRSIELPPMNASERKVVHMSLRKLGGVWTESIGEEPDRRVVIHPPDSST
ncbi:MAG: protein jag [Actinobacteria bacterium]|nr:protein jag [Actinomycetota bacterium]MBU1943591.1 protein jag [Actinomycetota bacterium]MBU2688924.1 protein jag [Actinomycetota bacterium]